MKAETSFSLKDQLFNPEKVAYLADLLAGARPDFDRPGFAATVVTALPSLALKERIDFIAATLRDYLPADYRHALATILQALPPPLDPAKTDDDFGDFIIAPLAGYVAQFGCEEANLKVSLAALREITKRFSAENAIRTFINAFPERTLAFLDECACDENYHVRRLASEGTRPKLPWAQKLVIDYRAPLPILEQLYSDPTRYVTRSVANHLNDISKLDPELVVETLSRWQASGRGETEEMAFICQHGLRTLVKQGDKGALGLLGFGERPEIEVKAFATSTPVVKVGQAFMFSLTIKAKKKQKLLVDYVMDFASDGSKAGRKVFKLKQIALNAGEEITVKKKHPMRLMTTRRLYEGEHKITLQVNGEPHGVLTFALRS